MKTTTRLVLAAALTIAAVGCGGGDDDNGQSAPATNSSASTEGPATSEHDASETTEEASTTTTSPAPSADELLTALTAAGLPIGTTATFTEETDPNDLLGRPGQYAGKIAWIDTRVECPDGEPDTTCGGDAEFFSTNEDRDERYDYLAGFADTPPIGGYYMWRLPKVIVRVGYELTPTQAQEYAAALEQLTPGELEQYQP